MKTRKILRDDVSYEVPTDWSDNAINIFIDKYCRSQGEIFAETSMEQVFQRLVDFWKLNIPELFDDLWQQKASPNSPQYFNAGIYQSYSLPGSDIGLWFTINNKQLASYNTYQYPQLHACFIQPIDDSLEGIHKLLGSEMRLFSRGSGTGTNFSDLRGKDEKVTGGGTSSGLISFLKIFDTMAGAIKSGGTTRRAAKMVVVDVNHPDIVEFVNWKVNEERKAKILIEHGGYDGKWEGEAYQSVSGQNSNNSVRLSDKFMKAVQGDELWALTNGKQIIAKKLWHEICQAAWHCADPGVQFSDTINRWNTTPLSGEIRASNPCSEHLRLDNSACNLASINLLSLLGDDGQFNYLEFANLVKRWTRVLDKSVDLAGYPTAEIAEGAHNYRDIGLGYCGLGALLIRLGVPYDSDEGRLIAQSITALMNAVAYNESTVLAQESGSYPQFNKNAEDHKFVLYRHWGNLPDQYSQSELPNRLSAFIKTIELAEHYYDSAKSRAEHHGIRNAQLTVIAPTGTIGLTMDSETTGIEPLFDVTTSKELSGGGYLKQFSRSVEIAKECGNEQAIQTAIGDHALPPLAHVKMLAAVQPHISGGISKTVNMPNDASVDDIDQIYMQAFEKGVKCVAVYRDGCKEQPLTAECKSCGDDEACDIA